MACFFIKAPKKHKKQKDQGYEKWKIPILRCSAQAIGYYRPAKNSGNINYERA